MRVRDMPFHTRACASIDGKSARGKWVPTGHARRWDRDQRQRGPSGPSKELTS